MPSVVDSLNLISQTMENILVYVSPIEIEKGKWGYKWIGICNGKRFSVIRNPYATEMVFDQSKQEYLFIIESQKDILPMEIKRLMYSTPLPNRYFLLGKGKFVSIEVVVSLIEKGYDITKVKKELYYPYINGNYNPYLCRYKTETEIIVEILDDESIVWKGGFPWLMCTFPSKEKENVSEQFL